MGAITDLFIRFRKQLETSDHHKDESLQTHYYKTNFNQLFDSIEKIFREDADCQIATVSKDHGEIAVELKKPVPCFLIITVVSVRPFETAVDFNISTERFSPVGIYPSLRKRVISFYEKIGKVHTFVGKGKNI